MSKLEIIDSEKNYAATVIKLPYKQAVPWLDNLVKVTVFGNDCLVGKESDENQLYVFFLCESVLSSEFLSQNNLYRDSTRNKDTTKKWFFEDNGRVKAIKFKGVTSTGFVIPITSLHEFWNTDIYAGDEFHSINGHEICRKYIREVTNIPKTRSEQRQAKLNQFDMLIPSQFKFHDDTLHFLKYINQFSPEDYISITEKYHGTSAVFANVLVNKKLSLVERIAKKLGLQIVDTEYYPLYSSRTVVKNRYINASVTDGFYKEDVWKEIQDSLVDKIEKGITLYGEIVGYSKGGSAIQSGYHYGCSPWTNRFIVYRITSTNVDGFVTEFTDKQVRQYCERYGLEVAHQLFYGKLAEFGQTAEEIAKEILEKFNIEKMCEMNNFEVPYEGICIRRDAQTRYDTYKIKSRMFLGYETKLIDEGVEISS